MPCFAEFAVDLTYEDLPKSVLWTLRRSFLDTMGVAACASQTELADTARRAALAVFGAGLSEHPRMLFDGRRINPAGAAMAGAFTIDSVDAHDGTTPNKGHAGSAIFPSVLALADSAALKDHRVSGRDFAIWLAIAYEISYRAGQVQHATCPDYHTSGAWTAIGVAAAIARILSCSKDQIRHAAGIAEYHGPRSQMMRCIDHPTMLRDGVGWGAPTGVTAAFLAREGFTGAPALTCESAQAEPFWDSLGRVWLTAEHTHYKRYPCCRWAHPAMDAAQDLVTRYNLHQSDVDRIEIRTFAYATRLAGHEPKTQDELAYSIAFPVAAMVVRGTFGPAELNERTLFDPDILRLSTSTKLIEDEDLTKRSTDKRWASVALLLKNGQRLDAPARSARGDRDDPLSDGEINTKFHAFADPVLGADRAARLRKACAEFDTLGPEDFAELLNMVLQGKNARQ